MHSTTGLDIFTRAEALQLGWSDGALARAVRSGRLVRVRSGHFVTPAFPAELANAIAAARACGAAAVSHRSALLLDELPLVGQKPARTEVTVPPLGPVSLSHAHVHRATLPPEHVTELHGVRVTSTARTLVYVGRHHRLTLTVAAADHALHEGKTNVTELQDVLRFCWNWPSIRRASRALALVDARAESPLESISRLAMRRLHLPTPDLQSIIRDEVGVQLARLDFYWDEFGVAGEADGRVKYDDRSVLTAEKERQERLENLGLIVVRWGWADVTRSPQQLASRLLAAFERGRVRDRSGITRDWSVSP